MGYQKEIIAGNSVTRSGQPWNDLQAALEYDRFNAFANFVAAKVELASGKCDDALGFVERSLERGSSFPALIAAMEAEALSCSLDADTKKLATDRLRAIAQHNPDPDPLLHLYLVLASLSADDINTAERIADRTYIQRPEGAVETTSDTLRRALVLRQTKLVKHPEFADQLNLFIWNKKVVRRIIRNLSKAG
jgi:lipopolysaccharide biosynthesis regulator YciM